MGSLSVGVETLEDGEAALGGCGEGRKIAGDGWGGRVVQEGGSEGGEVVGGVGGKQGV